MQKHDINYAILKYKLNFPVGRKEANMFLKKAIIVATMFIFVAPISAFAGHGDNCGSGGGAAGAGGKGGEK